MRDMTNEQALAEARRRWGSSGKVRQLGSPSERPGTRGRLARYRFTVGNNDLGPSCTIKGQGDSWRAAFDDSAARS
jgi:hypothetical protein